MGTLNKMSDVRNLLVETMERLRDGDIEVDRARAISEVGQTLIDSAKAEVLMVRESTLLNPSAFFDGPRTIEASAEPAKAQARDLKARRLA